MSDGGVPFDSIAALRRGWRRLLVGFVAGSAAAVAFALLSPPWYEAHLTILAMTQSRSQLGTVFGAALPVDLLPPEIGGGAADSERIAVVLRSVSVSDETIARFKLVERYSVHYVEQARKRLWEHCSTKVERKSGLVTLACEDRDPKVAAELVQHMGEVGNQTFRRVSRSSAGEERRFLEERVAQARVEKEAAARKLREFQESHGVVDIAEQSKAVIAGMTALRTQLIEKEVQLEAMKRYSAADEATVVQLRDQIAVLRAKLKSLEEQLPASEKTDVRDLFPPAMAVPKLRFELEQLVADQRISDAIYLALTQRFEMAKVNEARDTSTFQILDAPTVPEVKVRPQRVRMVIYGALLGLLAGAAWVVGQARLRWRAAAARG